MINFSRQGLVIINGLSLSAVYLLLMFFARFYIVVDTAAYDDSLLSKHLMFQQFWLKLCHSGFRWFSRKVWRLYTLVETSYAIPLQGFECINICDSSFAGVGPRASSQIWIQHVATPNMEMPMMMVMIVMRMMVRMMEDDEDDEDDEDGSKS